MNSYVRIRALQSISQEVQNQSTRYSPGQLVISVNGLIVVLDNPTIEITEKPAYVWHEWQKRQNGGTYVRSSTTLITPTNNDNLVVQNGEIYGKLLLPFPMENIMVSYQGRYPTKSVGLGRFDDLKPQLILGSRWRVVSIRYTYHNITVYNVDLEFAGV